MGNVTVATCGGDVTTVSSNACVAVEEAASVTLTVKLNDPLVVGVPEITPLVAKVNPVGNVPEIFVQV